MLSRSVSFALLMALGLWQTWVKNLVPGVLLGLIVPREVHPLLTIAAISLLYSMTKFMLALGIGGGRAKEVRRQLAKELRSENGKEPSPELLDVAVEHASLGKFVYQFNFHAFVVCSLAFAVPVAVIAAITYGIRVAAA